MRGTRIVLAAAVAAGWLLAACPALAQGGNGFQEKPLLRVQLRPKRIIMLSSQMSGRLVDVAVDDGETFAKGRILFRLDCSLPEAQLERARALKSRKDKIAALTAQLRELKSRSALEADVAWAEAREAAAEVKVGEALAARCQVAAPFDGRAGEVLARTGQYVSEGQPVMEILAESELEVEFLAPSHWFRFLKPGLRFPVDINETGTAVMAEVVRLGGKVDPVSQSLRVYARLVEQPPGLMAGMSGAARLEEPR
jgi:RND family efflux transporter MFP subunit